MDGKQGNDLDYIIYDEPKILTLAGKNFLLDLWKDLLGIKEWFDWQLETFEKWLNNHSNKALLFYRTGGGKSVTSLVMLRLKGFTSVLVIAPPSTHPAWQEAAAKLSMKIECISHAKFRQPDYKLSKFTAVIADEFHLFGGSTGKGYAKMDRLARSLEAPVILCSATPNYNDADRCYCVQHILDPESVKGGILQFIYSNCITEQNPFGAMPIVKGFQRYPDAASYLESLPGVYYLPDNVESEIQDVVLPHVIPDEFEEYGYLRREHRLMASGMEERWARSFLNLIGDDGLIRAKVYDEVGQLVGNAGGPVLIFAASATVALAMFKSLEAHKANAVLITGHDSKIAKNDKIQEFRDGVYDIMVGTATMGTGTDGLDKVCDTMILLQDTTDDAFRRQLIGRILPRGEDVDASGKTVWRVVFE